MSAAAKIAVCDRESEKKKGGSRIRTPACLSRDWSPACLAVAVLEFGPIAANEQTETPGRAVQGEAS